MASRAQSEMNMENAKAALIVARLRAQAQHCEFENLKACDSPQEQMIIMGLIGGMYSSESKSKILARIQEHGDMTTTGIVEFIQQHEQVMQYAAGSSADNKIVIILVNTACQFSIINSV